MVTRQETPKHGDLLHPYCTRRWTGLAVRTSFHFRSARDSAAQFFGRMRRRNSRRDLRRTVAGRSGEEDRPLAPAGVARSLGDCIRNC
jgi:hypothetical protein